MKLYKIHAKQIIMNNAEKSHVLYNYIENITRSNDINT